MAKSYLNRVESAIELAEEDRKRKLLGQRIEVARAGMAAFQAKQIKPALEAYHTYLALLEEAKGVAEGGLLPLHFDVKRDVAELRMLAGIYWDLTRLYDQAQSMGKKKEFHHYLEKYVTFTKGMPFQASNASALRKHINSKKVFHKEEFRSAYRILGGSKCFIAGALVDVIQPTTIPILRDFRDSVLKHTHLGRRFVFWYYRYGPGLARGVEKLPRLIRVFMGKSLDQVAFRLNQIFLMNHRSKSLRSKHKLPVRETKPHR
jgi:hypothetical protein